MDLLGTIYIPSSKNAPESTTSKTALISKIPKWCYEATTICDISTKNIVLFTSAYPLHLYKESHKTGLARPSGFLGQPGGHGLSSSNVNTSINQTFGSLRGGLENRKGLNSMNDSYYVFVADLNTPWDIVLITTRPTEITTLCWDLVTSEEFVLADSEGYIETWHMNNSVITDWSQAAHLQFPSEQFLKAKFIHGGRQIYINLDKQDSIYFKEKFVFRNAPEISQNFIDENIAACLLISSTGLAVLLAYSLDNDPSLGQDVLLGPMNPIQPRSVDGDVAVLSIAKSLGPIRGRVRQVDISFNKEGQLLVATSNGDPRCPIRFYSLMAKLEEDICAAECFLSGPDEMQNKILSLEIHAYPGIFIKSASSDQIFEPGVSNKGVNGSLNTGVSSLNEDEETDDIKSKNLPTSRGLNEESTDICQAIVDLCFVECDDNAFSILVATQHPSGGRVELWELKESQLTTNKIFLPSEGSQQTTTKNIIPVWQYQEVFVAGSSSAQVVKISTPHSAFQTGRAAACYVTIAYTDGSIQCLLRDSLQQIGCVDIPKSGNPQTTIEHDAYPYGASAAKVSRMSSVAICDAAFSANGNILVVVDSLGQLYIYRMSPISDPGGLHAPDSIVLMLIKCILSGYDWWDIGVCCAAVSLAGNKGIQGQSSTSASLSPFDVICEKLTEDFNKQPTAFQNYYFNKFISTKASIYRLASAGWGSSSNLGTVSEYKAADNFMQSMLTSIHGTFKSLLRPGSLIDFTSNDTAFDKVSKILTAKMKDEIDVDRLANLLDSKRNEFYVEPSVLQSYHHLIQWTTDLALNLCARIPEFKGRIGTCELTEPGAGLLSNTIVLNMLRELLLLIRLWGKSIPAIRPVYTKTSADDSFDVLPKLFHIITKVITQPNSLEDSLIEKAVLLPSHIMIPPIHHSLVCARGLAPALTSGQGKCPSSYEFGSEPPADTYLMENTYGGASAGSYGGLGISPVMWSSTTGAIDCVKHMFLGKWPFSVKACTR